MEYEDEEGSPPDHKLKLSSIEDGPLAVAPISFLSLDTFYTLEVIVDSDETMNVYLYDDYPASIIASITGETPTLPAHAGVVGVACQPQATFNDFSVNGTRDPSSVPTASEWGMLLLCIILASSALWAKRRRAKGQSA